MSNKIELKFDTGTDEKIVHDRRTLTTLLAQKNYIYIRVPRTGSTSISDMLGGTWPHFYASLVKDLIGKEDYEKRFSFASVRNPWDRLVSWYLFNVSDPRANTEQSRRYRDLGFKGWIMASCPYSGHKPHHFAHIPKDPISQLSWILDKDNKLIVDKIVKLEEAEKDFESIKTELGLSQIVLSRLNNSPTRKFRNYREYYDDETREKVMDLYGEDVRYFGYEF